MRVGGGHLVDKLRYHGYCVWSTDLIDRGHQNDLIDFLKCHKSFNGDIVTNPPYKFCTEFIIKALDLINVGNKVCMFLKLTTLEGGERYRNIYSKYPPKNIYVYSKRIQCAKNGEFKSSSAVCYAWFVWVKGYKGKPTIDWIY